MTEDLYLKEIFEKIKAMPDIDYNDRGKEYKSKCICGGKITAYRVKYNGHLRAKCDKCDFKIIE